MLLLMLQAGLLVDGGLVDVSVLFIFSGNFQGAFLHRDKFLVCSSISNLCMYSGHTDDPSFAEKVIHTA